MRSRLRRFWRRDDLHAARDVAPASADGGGNLPDAGLRGCHAARGQGAENLRLAHNHSGCRGLNDFRSYRYMAHCQHGCDDAALADLRDRCRRPCLAAVRLALQQASQQARILRRRCCGGGARRGQSGRRSASGRILAFQREGTGNRPRKPYCLLRHCKRWHSVRLLAEGFLHP